MASLLLLAAFYLPARADDVPLPRFSVDTATESRPGCVLTALAADRVLHVEQALTPLGLRRVIGLRQDGTLLPPLLQRDFVLLTNGDRLPLDPGAAASLDEARLTIWPAKSLAAVDAQPLSLYLPNVVLLFWSLPDGMDDADLFFTRLESESRKRDVVHLKNGDRLEGTVSALAGKIGCKLITADRKIVTVPWPKLAGIAWNTERQARLRAKNEYARAVLDGGARVNLIELAFADKPRRWIGKTQFGATLDLPERAVLALDVRQAHAVDLADLAPARYEHRPYLGVSWPLAVNAAVTGHPLKVAGSTYEKGVGMHAASEAAYKLDGQYTRFDCEVGLDAAHARHGRVRLAIKLDGKRVELNDGKELTSRDPPVSVRLDVRNVRELTLIAERSTFGDVQAHVNWAGARLIKRE